MTTVRSKYSYALPAAGLPPQTERFADRAIFTNAYAFIPRTVMTDIVTSSLPFWEKTRLWVIARPLTGFSESFSHYIMEVSSKGGSDRPDDNISSEHVLFIVDGSIELEYTVQFIRFNLVIMLTCQQVYLGDYIIVKIKKLCFIG